MMTLLSFIVVLGILVTVHELGHFLVAKSLRIGVERFSIGFPPKMFGFTRGETEYCVSWIPLGGYVKLLGENPDEPVDDPEDPRLFSTRPPLQRAAVIMAGPVMNLTLAFLIMPLVYLVGVPEPAYLDEPVKVGWVEEGSVAAAAGFQVDDRVRELSGEPVDNWEDFSSKIAAAEGEELVVTVEGLTGSRRLVLDLRERDPSRPVGLSPHLAPVIGALTPGFPASKAGLKKGDRVVSIDGRPVRHWYGMAERIHSSAGRSITVVVDRGGEELTFDLIPQADEKTGNGLLGILPDTPSVVQRYPLVEAVRLGVARNLDLLAITFGFLADLVTLKSSIKNLGGPIMIFQVTGQAAKAGISQFLHFMAFLSLQLGILNLLPIPVLDGGHLVFLGIEGAARRPVSPAVRDVAMRIGLFLLLSLILVISYNDIVRILTG